MRENIESYMDSYHNPPQRVCLESEVRKIEEDLDLAIRSFGELEQNPRISRLIPMYILNVFSKLKDNQEKE